MLWVFTSDTSHKQAKPVSSKKKKKKENRKTSDTSSYSNPAKK